MIAAQNGNLEVVKLLVKKGGADITKIDEKGQSIFDHVRVSENKEIYSFLLETRKSEIKNSTFEPELARMSNLLSYQNRQVAIKRQKLDILMKKYENPKTPAQEEEIENMLRKIKIAKEQVKKTEIRVEKLISKAVNAK